MLREDEAGFSAVEDAVWLVGSAGRLLQWEDVRAAGDRDDAVDSAQVGGQGAVVRVRTHDELSEALDCMGWFGGEESAQCRADRVEQEHQRGGEGGGAVRWRV